MEKTIYYNGKISKVEGRELIICMDINNDDSDIYYDADSSDSDVYFDAVSSFSDVYFDADSSDSDIYYDAVSSFSEPDEVNMADNEFDSLFDQLKWVMCVLLAIMFYIFMSMPERFLNPDLDDCENDDHDKRADSSSMIIAESVGSDDPFHGHGRNSENPLPVASNWADNRGKVVCEEPEFSLSFVELFPINERDDFIYDAAFMPRYCPEPSGGMDINTNHELEDNRGKVVCEEPEFSPSFVELFPINEPHNCPEPSGGMDNNTNHELEENRGKVVCEEPAAPLGVHHPKRVLFAEPLTETFIDEAFMPRYCPEPPGEHRRRRTWRRRIGRWMRSMRRCFCCSSQTTDE